MGAKPVINMSTPIVKAAVDGACTGQARFAHHQNMTGLDVTIEGGVDILAHTIPSTEFHYTPDELGRFKAQHTACDSTLTLWTTIVKDQAMTTRWFKQKSISCGRSLRTAGRFCLGRMWVSFRSTILHSKLSSCIALSTSEVLASLTTNPAAYFKADKAGRVEKGLVGDVVVLGGDPVTMFGIAKVAYTFSRTGHLSKVSMPRARDAGLNRTFEASPRSAGP